LKHVLVSQRIIENESYSERRDALDVRWPVFLRAANIAAIPVGNLSRVEEYFDTFSPAGVLLTGGNDLASISPGEVNEMRDRCEEQLVALAIERKVPIVGVCRGAQFLAHRFGSTLGMISGHVGNGHVVSAEPGAKLSSLLGAPREVNSSHNYGIEKLSGELRAAARANDGSVEAFEHPTLPIFAMLWHPERFEPFSDIDIALFKWIFSS